MLVEIPGFDLMLTANSGQCFRMQVKSPREVNMIAKGQQLIVRELADGLFEFSCDEQAFASTWKDYFDLDTDYGLFTQGVEDAGSYLYQACSYAKGLRILRQDPFEALIAFILSQRKSIPAIADCINRLSAHFGTPIEEGVYSFPSPDALAHAQDEALAACGLGYRVPYVKNTARMIADKVVDFESFGKMDDQALHQALLGFPGVGNKVASCVALFGFHRLAAFPVDVWIQKVLDREYPQGFPHHLHQQHGGVLQQYMFCYERYLAGKL